MEGRRAPKDAGLHAVQALLPLTRGEPVEPAGPGYFLNGSEYSLTLSLSSAMSAASCSLMYFATVASSSPTVETQQPSAQNPLLPNRCFRFGVPVEDHERALALQAAHHARHAVLRRYRRQHAHMVGHEVPLYYLDALVLAEPPQDLPYVGPDLAVDGLSPILRREHDVLLAHPLRVRKAVGFVGHSRTPPFLLGFLTA